MQRAQWASAVLLAGALTAWAGNTGTDSTNKHVWAEDVGWFDTAPANDIQAVTVHFDGDTGWLSGHAWGENVGWLKMGSDAGGPYANTTSTDWGVNLTSTGSITGYAWGENVGWVTFGRAKIKNASFDMDTGAFTGYAWGENIGWLRLRGTDPDFGVRTTAFDVQARGTPNWWLAHHAVAEDDDAGDGVAAWEKFVMDTDPNVAGDYLRITSMSNSPKGLLIAFTPASPRRSYTLRNRADLTAGGWNNVTGQVAKTYKTRGEKALYDTNKAERMFYTVVVEVTP